MRKLIIFGLFIAIFISSASAYCVCIYKGPCGCEDDPYRSSNVTKIVLEENERSQVFWSRSDEAETSGLDTFEDSRPQFQSWEKKISVEIKSACLNEDIEVRSWYQGKPLAEATLKLYSHGGGRELVSEVTTSEQGWGVFGAKPLGKYDFVVEKIGYNSGQEIFEIGLCSPAKKQKTDDGQVKLVEEEVIAAVYADGYNRKYLNGQIGIGQKATKVRLSAQVQVGEFLIERIPRDVISDKSIIGFENLYPQRFEQNEKEIILGWQIPYGYEGEIVREYIIMQNIRADTVDDMELSFEGGSVVLEKTEKGIIESIFEFFGLA